MFIHIDPSELRTTSRWPTEINVTPCPGLEALTGADFTISRIPISPVLALDSHIKNRTLFCQRKSGYDAVSFDQVFLEIERMQACKIPMMQAFILPIGVFSPNRDGTLTINNSAPVSKSISYETYLKLEAEYAYSGVQVRRLNTEAELEIWIRVQFDELQRIEKRDNKKQIWSSSREWTDPWQSIEEIDDWRHLFLAGLKGFGEKACKATQETMAKYEMPDNGFYALKILSSLDGKKKPKYKVAGWGLKSIQKLRVLLGLPDGMNLQIDGSQDYILGWHAALAGFKELVSSGKSGKEAWEQLKNKEIVF